MQHTSLLMMFGLKYLFWCQEKELLQKNLKIILLLFDQENSVHSLEKKISRAISQCKIQNVTSRIHFGKCPLK